MLNLHIGEMETFPFALLQVCQTRNCSIFQSWENGSGGSLQ